MRNISRDLMNEFFCTTLNLRFTSLEDKLSDLTLKCLKYSENIEEVLVDSKRAKYDRVEMKIEIKEIDEVVKALRKRIDCLEPEIESL
jgi:hypothetical protein